MIKSHQLIKNIPIIFFSINLKFIESFFKRIFNIILANIEYESIIKSHHIHQESFSDLKQAIYSEEFQKIEKLSHNVKNYLIFKRIEKLYYIYE